MSQSMSLHMYVKPGEVKGKNYMCARCKKNEEQEYSSVDNNYFYDGGLFVYLKHDIWKAYLWDEACLWSYQTASRLFVTVCGLNFHTD